MNVIPLQALPSQTFSITIASQQVTIALYQKGDYMFIDITVNGNAVRSGRMVRDRTRLVRYAYLGFTGDLMIVDTQGANDPNWQLLGSRYTLVYLSPTDLTTMGITE